MTGKGKRIPGVGQCGSPDCLEPRAEGRYVCSKHGEIMDRIREEIYGIDPRARFTQGGVNVEASARRRRQKLGPTCCYVGCYEPRDPPTPFCLVHQGNESD